MVSQIEMPSATTSAGSASTRHKPGVFPPAIVSIRRFGYKHLPTLGWNSIIDPHRGTLGTDLLFSQRKCAILPVGNQNGGASLIL